MPSTSEPNTKQRPPLRERKLLILSASFAAMEGFDLACYGTTVPSLLADKSMGATPSSAGTVGSLVAVGMLIGAALAAVLVNRFGSRKLLLLGTLVFSIGMLGCALSPTITLFGAARLLVGLGLGAVLPTLLAYVAEMTAPGRRSRNVGITMAGYAAGALAAPLLAAALLPAHSYRWIYVIGAIPALILIPIAWRVMPDTSRQTREVTAPEVTVSGDGVPVDTHGGSAKVDGLRQLFAPGVRAATLLFWVMSFCGLLLVFGISTWLPTIMQTAGYSLGSSLLQTAAMWVGAGVGMIVGGRVADTLGPKPVVTAAFLIGCVSLIIMSINPSIVVLFLLMFVSGVGFIGAQVLTNAYIVTAYPDTLRGPAIGWALSIGRLGAIVGPSLGGWVLSSGLSVQWNFYSFAIWGAIGAVATLLVPKVIRPVAARQTANTGHL